jgi:phospholipid N-methyltransferase
MLVHSLMSTLVLLLIVVRKVQLYVNHIRARLRFVKKVTTLTLTQQTGMLLAIDLKLKFHKVVVIDHNLGL